MTTDTFDEINAAYQAKREVDQAHRTTLPPLDLSTLKFTIGEARPDTCERCDRHETLGTFLGVATGETYLCGPCIEHAGGRVGEAIVMLIDGLEDVAAALLWADTGERLAIATLGSRLFARIVRPFSPEPLGSVEPTS